MAVEPTAQSRARKRIKTVSVNETEREAAKHLALQGRARIEFIISYFCILTLT